MERSYINEYTEMRIKEGILYIKYKPNLKITLEVAMQCVNDRLNFCEGIPYPMIAELSDMKEVSKEAKKYLSSEEATIGIVAGAFIVRNHFYKLIGSVFVSLYVNLHPHTPPSKLFNNKSEAINWIKKFITLAPSKTV
jgi:hypothetical protein